LRYGTKNISKEGKKITKNLKGMKTGKEGPLTTTDTLRGSNGIHNLSASNPFFALNGLTQLIKLFSWKGISHALP
jgi:hypothetical protein